MILGLDIGGTNTDIVLLDKNEFKIFGTIKTKDFDLRELEIDYEAVGIGIAVWFKRGKMVLAPNLEKIPFIETEKPKILENDAKCFAYFSANTTGKKNVLALTIGTGIGTGIVIKGELYKGDGLAGEMGHTFVGGRRKCKCGGYGHLECYFSGWAIGDAKSRLEDRSIYGTRSFKLFCKSVAAAIMLLNPEIVTFGGRIGGRLDELILKKEISNLVPKVFEPEFRVIRDDFAVAKGAAMLARDVLGKRF
ncbi:MAG: ROK family protein [Archaeoglobaceae archaeon]|nr:ROK family protein [Archaeoglobaceae archaeon]MDW7990083.1 ROK family protein [Archaeoglobaceae archaeon]